MEIRSKDRRALIILGSAAAIGLLLFVFVLHKHGSTTSAQPAGVGGSQPTPAVTPSPSPSGNGSHGKQHQSPGGSVFTGRDPFKPLVVDTTGTTPASPGPVPAPSPSPSPVPSPSPTTSPAPVSPPSIQHAGHTVTLIGFQRTASGVEEAVVSIDGKQYRVPPGQTIVFDFKLASIHFPCGDFLHGAHPFSLCVAGATTK
jgi:hypothetical protein